MSAELYDDPPEEGDFKNGDTHTDSSGSWTYQNGVWYDNTGNDNNIIEEIVITSHQNNSNNLYNGISTIQCHHNTSTPNGEKIDLSGGLGGLNIYGVSRYDMGQGNIPGKSKTINYDEISILGAGGASTKNFMAKYLQYLSSAMGTRSNSNSNKSKLIKESNDTFY